MTEETVCKLSAVPVTDMTAVGKLAAHLVCDARIEFSEAEDIFGFSAESAVHWDDSEGPIYEFLDRLRKFLPEGQSTSYVEVTIRRHDGSVVDIEGFSYTVTRDEITSVMMGEMYGSIRDALGGLLHEAETERNDEVLASFKGIDSSHVDITLSGKGTTIQGVAAICKERVTFEWNCPKTDAADNALELIQEAENSGVLDDESILRAANQINTEPVVYTTSASSNLFRVKDVAGFAALVSHLVSEWTLVRHDDEWTSIQCANCPVFEDPSLPDEAHDGCTDISLFMKKLAKFVVPGDAAVFTITEHRNGRPMCVDMYVALNGGVTHSSFSYAPCETLQEPEKNTPSA